MKDSYYMDVALRYAKEAAEKGEVPVGAILVRDGEIFSAHGNSREKSLDPTAHAEVLALQHAAERVGNWRLEDSTMYATVEPCLMCTGALILARVKRVVFGCTNPKGGALRFVMAHRQQLNLNHEIEIVGGVRELECAQVLKDFFKARRTEV
jgi:tRNA(adenine34) deaminase